MDVLLMVPCLLSSCLSLLDSTSEGIQTLRLVNKQLNQIALTAVTSCTVCIGQAAFPTPQQIVKLISHAQLQSLYIWIQVCTGGCDEIVNF